VGQWAGAWIPWTVQLADFPRGRGAADGFTRLRDLISCNCCLSRGAGMGGDGRGREGTGGGAASQSQARWAATRGGRGDQASRTPAVLPEDPQPMPRTNQAGHTRPI
jgi:hypothetical protein